MQPKVFLINLARDTARLNWMDTQFRALGLAYERFDAVSPHSLARAPSDIQAMLAKSLLQPGEVACWASHLMVMEMIVQRKLPYAVVMEDDVRLSERLGPMLVQLDTLPEDWGMLRFTGGTKHAVVPVRPYGRSPTDTLVKYSRIPMGIGAYAISRRGALAVRQSGQIGQAAVDAALRRWWNFDIRTYGIEPAPVEHNAFGGSSIGDFGGVARIRLEGKGVWRYSRERVLGELANLRFLGKSGWVRSKAVNMFRTRSGP